MFLDQYTGLSEEATIAYLDDLQLECAVSLEAAYSDLMLEGCQAEFQAISEGNSLEAINEGLFDVIKKFFKAIWNFLKKIFGVKGSGGSSGGGESSGGSSGGSTNTKDQKKEAEELDKELENQRKSLEKLKQLSKDSDEMIKQNEEELKQKMKEVQAKQMAEIAQKIKDKKAKEEYKKRLIEVLNKVADQKKMDEVRQQIINELKKELDKICYSRIYDPFVDICPLSNDFVNSILIKMDELCKDIYNVQDMNQKKFEDLQEMIEYKFMRAICETINKIVHEMRYTYRYNGALCPWEMDIESFPTVANVLSRYKELIAPRKSFLQIAINKKNHSYTDFKEIIQSIRSSASQELEIDFQAKLDELAKETMNDIKKDNSYTNENIGSLIARIKMRLISDLSQIIGAMGIENKKARFYQLNGIRNLLHGAKQIDAVLAKINDKDYIESMMRKRMQV